MLSSSGYFSISLLLVPLVPRSLADNEGYAFLTEFRTGVCVQEAFNLTFDKGGNFFPEKLFCKLKIYCSMDL